MTRGIGFDLIDVPRVQRLIEKNESYLHKVFTEDEIEYCNKRASKYQSFAARFAAKEAFLKAIGTGWRNGISFNEIGVVNNELGKPELVLTGKAATIAGEMEVTSINVSLTHLPDIAGAFVILE